jgi:membrane fusion protein (multidrug efflux system)
MAETVLEFTPKQAAAARPPGRSWLGALRARARLIFLVLIPLLVLAVGVAFYLRGGRYISTDNAYVGAEKVLVTPDISGKVSRVLVHEGQHVSAGDPLFDIDPVPFRLALDQAQAKLESVRTDFANLKSNYQSLHTLVDLAKEAVDLKKRDLDRKKALANRQAGSQIDVETSEAAVLTAQLQLEFGQQQLHSTLNQLLGKPDLPIDDFPAYQQAKAALDQAQRDLDHTTIKSAISGIATQVDNIQLGRFVTAGMPVFSVMDDQVPWVDANPKETDITYLRVGQGVDIEVDSFPGRSFHGRVASVSPGTGAQFAILPPQNANGNWVKVVQRVPVRIVFDPDQDLSLLRAGMSVNVDIDTGRVRTFASLFGAAPSVAGEAHP